MNKEKTTRVLNYLEELFPDAYCELNHDSDFQLLVAVMLSAQTTDKKVNELTKDLFKKYRKRYSPYGSVASMYLWEVSGGCLNNEMEK